MEEVALKEYCREVEPDGETKSYAWSTAIGLQAMGGLQISKFLIDTAIQNIAGGISIKVARKTIEDYYGEDAGGAVDRKAEEADRLAAGTFALLTEGAFSFSVNTYIAIHRKLFEGMEGSAGSLRDFNIKRKEWVLDEESVLYAGEAELQEMLACLFMEEKDFSYKGLSMEEIIRHLAEFIAELWQIHAFSKGSTRVSAIFFIKYLESLGFSIQNNAFAENPLYFRNALVRANYTNLQKGIFGTTEYLELFLRNLLLNEQNLLDNESLHISVEIKKAEEERLTREREAKKEKERLAKELEAKKEEERIIRELEIRKEVERIIKELEVKKLEEIIAREREVEQVEERITEAHIIGDNVNTEKTDFAEELYRKERTERENRIAEKVKLATKKAIIECCDVKMQNDNENKESEKEHFIALLSLKSAEFSSKTISHIERLFEEFAFQKIFGRTAVIEILHLKNSGASKFLLNLLQAGIIENVSGYGKGKYKFKK